QRAGSVGDGVLPLSDRDDQAEGLRDARATAAVLPDSSDPTRRGRRGAVLVDGPAGAACDQPPLAVLAAHAVSPAAGVLASCRRAQQGLGFLRRPMTDQ